MQSQNATETKKDVHNENCTHTRLDKEVVKDVQTNNFVCKECGTTFTHAEKEKLDEKRKHLSPTGSTKSEHQDPARLDEKMRHINPSGPVDKAERERMDERRKNQTPTHTDEKKHVKTN